ncbi:MAG: tetratricopeptide repeat protein, partial [Proteobacteria bacterium]|nr:tetratricopeptide repeat protein [Pseudomonadota bacterium]
MGGAEATDTIAQAKRALQRGDAALADRQLRAFLTQHPHNAEAWRLLGMAQNGQGDFVSAVASLHRAIQGDPR